MTAALSIWAWVSPPTARTFAGWVAFGLAGFAAESFDSVESFDGCRLASPALPGPGRSADGACGVTSRASIAPGDAAGVPANVIAPGCWGEPSGPPLRESITGTEPMSRRTKPATQRAMVLSPGAVDRTRDHGVAKNDRRRGLPPIRRATTLSTRI